MINVSCSENGGLVISMKEGILHVDVTEVDNFMALAIKALDARDTRKWRATDAYEGTYEIGGGPFTHDEYLEYCHGYMEATESDDGYEAGARAVAEYRKGRKNAV